MKQIHIYGPAGLPEKRDMVENRQIKNRRSRPDMIEYKQTQRKGSQCARNESAVGT